MFKLLITTVAYADTINLNGVFQPSPPVIQTHVITLDSLVEADVAYNAIINENRHDVGYGVKIITIVRKLY